SRGSPDTPGITETVPLTSTLQVGQILSSPFRQVTDPSRVCAGWTREGGREEEVPAPTAEASKERREKTEMSQQTEDAKLMQQVVRERVRSRRTSSVLYVRMASSSR